MDRRTKIQLLEHWLSSPESLGDIPREFKDRVTTKDFFDIKKEMDWKPPTKENVEKLLRKTKYLGVNGGGRVKTKVNPALFIIIIAAGILPTYYRIFSNYGLTSSSLFLYISVLLGIILLVIFLWVLHYPAKRRGRAVAEI